MAGRNHGTSNRNRRGSVGEWLNDFNEETAANRIPENELPENQPPENQPPENQPPENQQPENQQPENRSIENTIQWRWEQIQAENGGQEIEEVANDRTLKEWISITENKDLFRSSYGGKGENTETSPMWTDQPENRRFYGRPRRDGDDDDDDDHYGAAGGGNRIGTTQAYVSGTSGRGNTGSSIRDSRGSNNNNRSASGSGNGRNSVGNTTEGSAIGCTNVKLNSFADEDEEEDEYDNEQTKHRTFCDWLKYTKNPDLYKTENEMDDDDDDEYNENLKYINLESVDENFWENVYAQILLATELDEMDNTKKRKKAYSLFNGGSDYDSNTSPKKRMAYSLFALQNCETTDAAMEKDDMNKTPSMFDIRKNETNYSENFPKNPLNNRDSLGVNKSTDSFESDSSITPIKLSLHRQNQNFSVTERNIDDFFNLNTIYETERKPLKKKMEEEEEEEEKIAYEPFKPKVELIKKKNEIEKKRERREKREDQILYKKGSKLMDLEQFAFINTTKRVSCCKSDMLHYMETNSETEITTASPGVNEIDN